MSQRLTITREWLEAHHIIDISKDGVVTAVDRRGDNYIIKPVITTKKSRYGMKQYHLLPLYDKDEYLRQKEAYKPRGAIAVGMRTYVLARCIWAWHYGECPNDMDVDHINNNSLDDRLDNLQLLTRADNLRKRKGHMNQWESSYRGD